MVLPPSGFLPFSPHLSYLETLPEIAWKDTHKYTALLKFMNSVTHSFIHKYFLRASYVLGTVQKLGI